MAHAAHANAALAFYMPHFQGNLTLSVLSARRWGVCRTILDHRVCPEIAVYALIYEMVSHGQANVGIGGLLLHEGYLNI